MATDHFVSIPFRELPGGFYDNSGLHSGTSSTATDFMEFRWQSDTGSGATGITKKDIANAFEIFLRFYKEGGVANDGTDCPAL